MACGTIGQAQYFDPAAAARLGEHQPTGMKFRVVGMCTDDENPLETSGGVGVGHQPYPLTTAGSGFTSLPRRMDRLCGIGAEASSVTTDQPQLIRMSRDYRFLIGRQFAADGELYVVHGLQIGEGPLAVEASTAEGENSPRIFSISDVINSLLIEEEIELFNPNYLSAR